MGRRRTKAPRRGSLAYLPRKRAKQPQGRIHYWPDVELDSPSLIGFAGYKVGMNYVYLINDIRGSPRYGQEVICPITVVEAPPLLVCGIRAYSKTVNGLKASTEAWIPKLPRDAERIGFKPQKPHTSLKGMTEHTSQISEFRAILFTQPRLASVPQKRPEVFEVKVHGGTGADQLTYLQKILGKEVAVSEVFEEGQFVDVIGITKGKGVQGPVKRWGVKKRPHKSRKTVRGVGTLGPWSPHYVMYTVPRAGQMGFHQRSERNKRILKINVKEEELNPNGGFPHYGLVKGSNLILKGSVPGPAKQLLKFRYASHPPMSAEAPPRITVIGLQTAHMPLRRK